MVIREANKSDIPVLLDILRKSYVDVAKRFNLTVKNCPKHVAFYTPRRLKNDFAKGLKYFILEGSERPCGCVAFEKADSETCYLRRLAVLPEYRRKGFGKTLVNHIFEEAKKTGIRRVEIGIISEDTELKNWYKGFGFVEKETKKFDHLPFIVAFMSAEM